MDFEALLKRLDENARAHAQSLREQQEKALKELSDQQREFMDDILRRVPPEVKAPPAAPG